MPTSGIDYTAVAYSQLRWYPLSVRLLMRRMEYWEDIQQAVRLAAWISSQNQESLRDASNRAQREIYKVIRDAGVRRQKNSPNFIKREVHDLEEPAVLVWAMEN